MLPPGASDARPAVADPSTLLRFSPAGTSATAGTLEGFVWRNDSTPTLSAARRVAAAATCCLPRGRPIPTDTR